MLEHHITPDTNIQSFLDNLDPLYIHTIYLSKGIYRQKIKLSLSNVTIIGEDKDDTKIIFNDYSYKLHVDGLLYNTFRTSTLTITGSNNTLKSLTIENDAGHGPLIGQAIALSIYGNHTTVTNCHIKGNQDTLFIGPLPKDLSLRYAHILPIDERYTLSTLTTIEHSSITGNIDFIFGSGNCIFKSCNLIFNGEGYLAAPSTYPSDIGFVFYQCHITSLNSSYKVVLARPWRDFGQTTFIDTQFDNLNITQRYDSWDKINFVFREYPYIFDLLNQEIDEPFKQRLIHLFFH